MPEGPSIVLFKEELLQFTGKKIIAVRGSSKIDQSRLLNNKVISIRSWGKHLLICLNGFTLRVHLLMFGTYRINEAKAGSPVLLHLKFKNGEINLYTCSIKYLEGDVNDHYDWTADVMNDAWNPKNTKARLKKQPYVQVSDVLLDQDIFAGVGNIIKNEVLYRIRVHPESIVHKIPASKITKLIEESRNYSFQFLRWKRTFELKKHWLVYTKKKCLRCNLAIIKKYTGVKKRRSFVCVNCQNLYA